MIHGDGDVWQRHLAHDMAGRASPIRSPHRPAGGCSGVNDGIRVKPDLGGKRRSLVRDLIPPPEQFLVHGWADPMVEAVGFPVNPIYTETVFLAILGPSATVCLRRLSLCRVDYWRAQHGCVIDDKDSSGTEIPRAGAMILPRWLSIRQIADDLGVSPSTAYKWSEENPRFPNRSGCGTVISWFAGTGTRPG
jgi:hypothetical protein